MSAVNETRRRRWRRLGAAMLLLLLFTCLSLFPLPGHAQFYGKNKVQSHHLRWKTLHTPHFEIMHYEGAEELAVRASLIAEQAYREYANRLDVELPWQIPFVLYASHGDFSQTNISNQLIGEGTGGFSEPFRNRMVLPYNGSHADFVHVIRHELVHVFMFHMAFGRTNNIGGAVFFSIPLWFAEGIAEWMSIGWDGEAEVRVRYVVELASGSAWIVVMELERSLSELVPPPQSRLLAAMPNPFNPNTTLRWELAEAGRVRLDIFDVRGRRVRKLVDRELPPGPHALGFDGRDDDGVSLASGVYYILLDTGERQLRGRITLVR